MAHLVEEYRCDLLGHCARSPITAEYYAGVIRRATAGVGALLGRPASLADLTAEHLQAYVDGLTVQPRTKQYIVGALRSFFRFVRRRKLITEDIGAQLEAPRARRRRLPPVLTDTEADRLVQAPIALRSGSPSALDVRDAAILEFLYGSGLRNSEHPQLDKDRLRWRDGYMVTSVIGKGDKERLIVVEQGAALDALQRYLARRDELPGSDCAALFVNWYGARLSRRGLVYVVRRWARRVGLECWPHLLRHTYATEMVAACGESLRGVQELLGHDDPATTARYAQIDERRLRATARLHPRARRAPSLAEVGKQARELGRSASRLAAHEAAELVERLRARRTPPARRPPREDDDHST